MTHSTKEKRIDEQVYFRGRAVKDFSCEIGSREGGGGGSPILVSEL